MSLGRGRTERRGAAAVLLCAHLLGCHSWHTESAPPATVLAERHPAQVRVTQLDGHRLVIYQPYLAGDELEGLARPARGGQPAGDTLRMPVAGVSGLATRRFSAGRTVLAIVGGLVFAIVIDCASSGSCAPTLDY